MYTLVFLLICRRVDWLVTRVADGWIGTRSPPHARLISRAVDSESMNALSQMRMAQAGRVRASRKAPFSRVHRADGPREPSPAIIPRDWDTPSAGLVDDYRRSHAGPPQDGRLHAERAGTPRRPAAPLTDLVDA